MSGDEQWNALTRFCIYGSVIIIGVELEKTIAVFLLLIVLLIYLNSPTVSLLELIEYYSPHPLNNTTYNDKDNAVKSPSPSKKINKEFSETPCQAPSRKNPFMNITVDQYAPDKSNRPPACSLRDDHISKKANDHFRYGLFQDVDDLFGRKMSERNFYTTPISTIPNDQSKYAKWLYGDSATLKDAFKKT